MANFFKQSSYLELSSSKRDELFQSLKVAVETFRPINCEDIIEEISKYKLSDKDKKLFAEVKQFIEDYQLENALELL